jgi:hypothetical protein
MSYVSGRAGDNWVLGLNGARWFWQIEHDTDSDGVQIQRIFYWNEGKSKTGVMELRGNEVLHRHRAKQRILRIAKESSYRSRFSCPLRFLRSGRVGIA